MADFGGQLPPGWTSEWNAENQRFLFIDTASGHTQWEPPTQPAGPADDPSAAHPQQSGKRRQYAREQSQAYYGASDPAVGYGQQPLGYGAEPQPAYGSQPQQLFTPGLAAESQFANQQGQAYPGTQAGGYGQQQGYPQQQQQQPSVDYLAGQFGNMGFQGGGPSLLTQNLLSLPPDPLDLQRPPPEIRLSSTAAVSQAPTIMVDPSYQRCTLNAIPTTSTQLAKSKLPLALILTPYRTLKDDEPEVPVITDGNIPRCKRCLMYVNPFISFVEGGSRWRCCGCQMLNPVPQLFDWDSVTNQPGDRWARADINHSVVEYVAASEYMVRPPQPPVYVILIDVSHTAIQSGMVATAARTILENLDRIPDQDHRVKFSIVAFDVSLYFFTVPPGDAEPSMLVVSDLDDIFLPKPADLLVNLHEARVGIESILSRLNDMFAENHTVGSALGSALQAGAKLISPIGGKIIALTSSLPSVGPGALKNREDPKALGTSKESGLLQPGSPFYKTTAIEFSRNLVSVDMFLFSSTYQDVATLACLPHYTAGQTFFYPGFNAARTEDAIKFAHEFGEILAQPIMLEAIMRVRASKGLRIVGFHGNFFVRSADLLAMPTVPQDLSYAIEVQIEETITTPFVVFQTGLLHTTCTGERRVRVVTSAIPVTTNMSDIFASADQIAIATLLANKAVERTMTHKLEDARDALFQKLVDILVAYKSLMAGGNAGLAIPDNLKSLPVLVLGLLKSTGIRQGTQIPLDLRAYSQALLTSLPAQSLIPYLYPTFYSLHSMPPEAGTIGEHGVILPPPLPLTSEKFERHGLFLIEDGQNIFLYVGRDAVPQLVMDVFDLPSYEVLRSGKTRLPQLENSFSQRINAIVQKTRELRRGVYHQHLYVVKEDGEPALRLWALSCLVQDRTDVMPSYQQFLSQLRDKVSGAGGVY